MSKQRSDREQHFRRLWLMLGIPSKTFDPVEQYQFAPGRQFRFDFAWVHPSLKIAVEIDGGTRGQPVKCHRCGVNVRAMTRKGPGRELRLGGGHNRGDAFKLANEKQNLAVVMGWRVLRFLESDLDERPVQVIEQVVELLRQQQRKI